VLLLLLLLVRARCKPLPSFNAAPDGPGDGRHTAWPRWRSSTPRPEVLAAACEAARLVSNRAPCADSALGQAGASEPAAGADGLPVTMLPNPSLATATTPASDPGSEARDPVLPPRKASRQTRIIIGADA
jgi:hypothetical protein